LLYLGLHLRTSCNAAIMLQSFSITMVS
jgi:hypothetical protein